MNARCIVLAVLLAWPLQSLDDAAQQWVQHQRRPALEAPMRAATDLARPALVAAAVVALASAAGRSVLLEAVLVLAPLNLLVEGVKFACNRARPDGEHRHRNASFPSSHAANAFALATVLTRRWRRGGIAFFALASTIAFSRVYLNRHWPSDVLFAAALGIVVAWAVLHARARLRERRNIPTVA